MNSIVDSHCHLNFKDFENDLDAVILRAQNNGVNFLLTISINLEDFNIINSISVSYTHLTLPTMLPV